MTSWTTTMGAGRGARHRVFLEAGWATLGRVLGWPARVYRARQLMEQFGRMDDHELRDIGLMRQDLRDATAVAIDADPTPLLRARAARRRGRG